MLTLLPRLGLALAVVWAAQASPLWAAAPPPSAITPELIEAAKKEGKVIYYTSIDLPLAEKIAKAFEAKFPGVAVRVERSGAERIFQRIGQEYSANIHAVDVVNSSDAAQLIFWKREGMLAPFVPEDVAKHYPAATLRKFAWPILVGQFLSLIAAARQRNLWAAGVGRAELGAGRRASPTCSIRSGRARSSRRIRATAAPS